LLREVGDLIDVNANSRFVYGEPYTPPPPVNGVITDTGLGKTRQWRQQIAAPLIGQGLRPALAVPRHKLGDEKVLDLAAAGITGFVYRGRDADDPNAPGHKMCREQERIGAITQALGSVPSRACKNGDKKCPSFEVCGYQRQRLERPQMWIVPHQLLFHERPEFIPQPAALGIDESFYGAGLRGLDKPIKLWLRLLKEDRRVPGSFMGTVDLTAVSDRLYGMLMHEKSGRIRRDAIRAADVTVDDLRDALRLEWRRKKDIKEVYPAMPLVEVQVICRAVADHNQDVKRLTTFWHLLIQTIEGEAERSPFLELRLDEPISLTATSTEPAVRMAWRADVHDSWLAPTTVMDATMSPDIVRQFLPDMPEPIRISVPIPHTYIRQIIDRPMSSLMLIPKETGREKTNRTARSNEDRVREFIGVRANEARPGRVLVVCQLGLEVELKNLGLPENVALRHFNDVAGENAYNDIALLIVIGRTDPGPRPIENEARVLFGADIAELPPDARWYPLVERGVQMRDGAVAVIETAAHPDPRAEAVRWQICEAGLMQAIGRGRAVNRTADNPLQIDILTNVPLPIVTDEMTTWELIQPTLAERMRSRGAAPLTYRDMAEAHPDLFISADAARKALGRENPGQTPIENYLIGVCPGFSAIDYRRKGSRGPASTLLFDPKRIDPLPWLTEWIGEVVIKGSAWSLAPILFRQYLQRRRRTDTPQGYFVEDAGLDHNFPDAKTWRQVESYLWRRGADRDVIAAARKVWRQYIAHYTDDDAA